MRGIHIRIGDDIYNDIENIATTKNLTISQVLREIIELGIRIKKHMENKKQGQQEEQNSNDLHLEIGAPSAIETLLLLRRMARTIQSQWVEEAHAEAAERITKLKNK